MESVQSVPLRFLVLFLVCVSKCLSVEITHFSIPNFVANGSEESVLLDCEYTYDSSQDKIMVVRWFHENDPKPIYQWIPELNSKAYSEKFKVNEEFADTASTRSRAISIQNPTTKLSGTYRCDVQSYSGSDYKEDIMIVYAHPTSVNLNYTIEDGMVRVVCKVENVFPVPQMSLFQIKPKTSENSPLNDTELEYVLEDGAFDVEFSTTISEDDLPGLSEGLTFFGCSIEMNGTDYTKEIKLPYFPNPVAEKQEGDDSDSQDSSATTVFAPLSIFIMVLLLSLT